VLSFDIFLQSIPIVLTGLKLTLIITIAGFVLGQFLALPLALSLVAKSSPLRWLAQSYLFLIRGSPLLVQLFILYYGLAQFSFIRSSFIWPLIREPLYCAILAIGFNSAAYVSALIAGALKQMPSGQLEACISLGLSRYSRLKDVLLPQAYRAILPAISNEIILVLKASSLAGAVTVMEMTGAARAFIAKTYAPFEVFIVAGILYLIIGFLFAMMFHYLEQCLNGHSLFQNHRRMGFLSETGEKSP